MRTALLAIAIGTIAFGALAAPAAGPTTAEAFNARCKADAGLCRTTILAHTAALVQQAKICIPPNVSREEVADETADTLDDVLDDAGDDFRNADYRALIDQIIEFRWSCTDRPTS